MILLAREIRTGDRVQVPRPGGVAGDGSWHRVSRALRRDGHVVLRFADRGTMGCSLAHGWRVKPEFGEG